VQDGLIELTPGNAVDFAFVRARVSELAKQYQIESIGFDPWNAAQLSTELASDGMQMIEWRFGLRTMSGPSKEFEAAVAEGSMRHDGNPVLRWMADCVSIRSDASGNIIPVKPDRLKSEKRIDGIVAAIIARGLSVSTTQDAPPVLLGAV
jgi:phage terminase large subunit-like protein